MKIVLILFLLLFVTQPTLAGETMSGAETKGVAGTRVADMHILLNAFTALAEEHIEGTLRGMKYLTETEAVRSGDWNAMKGPLVEFSRSGINAAAVWYARPDGHYFTVEKNLTDQSLSDRPYFPRLMAGASVVGDLVISKSTGKRTAILALPIWKNGKVSGALGVSLSLDKMSWMLQEKMALPGDMVFYALDAHGQSSLHKDSNLLFTFPSDIGSKTLKDAAREMLSHQEGVARYEFHGEKIIVYKRSQLTGWVFAIGYVASPDSGAAGNALQPILSELQEDLSLKLKKVDADLTVAAQGLSRSGMRGPAARKILSDLCRNTPYAIDCATIDNAGTMLQLEPEEYRKFEGVAIGNQEQVIRLQKSGKPVVSRVIRTVEGIDAVDIEQPVFSPRGAFLGAVSILVKPEALLASVATTLVQGLPIDIWAMQTDGRILYDPDREEVGRMLFDDPIYQPFPQLQSLGATIAKERSGSGSYEFLGKGMGKPVTKSAYWTTVGLYGTEWRIVATHALADDGALAKRNLSELGVKSSEEALRELAERTELQEALAGHDRAAVQRLFRKFIAEQYGIYAIQWVDELGINREGYPVENSLTNYDLHAGKTPASKFVLRALVEKQESSFEAPLLEGKEGAFFLTPVWKGKTYLGMIYIIRLHP